MKIILAIYIILVSNVFALNLSEKITVSGISSGGFFAHQFHIANSNLVEGAAIFAAGPYYCAKGSVALATNTCMKGNGAWGSAYQSYVFASGLAMMGLIDPTTNLKDDKVYIFSGQNDKTVVSSVSEELRDLYAFFGVKNLEYEGTLAAGHTYPTENKGVECELSEVPYIGNCNYNGALKSLSALYPEKKQRRFTFKGKTVEVDQAKHFTAFDVGAFTPLLQDKAYLYIPSRCKGDRKCDLHVAFHGCKQTVDHIGMSYINDTGIKEAADKLDVVVLFPQAKKSVIPGRNPHGCWDWWGHSGANYHLKDGQQMRIIKAVVLDILQKP
ncbi:PHB depolymerase family esterase [Halobacteriovorax sp. XZX-3]|uniref:extracellular catalytic domain type 2 short-chain-length polyhydroxyalkanoate depolymerase n=1 Tax=unclassified Halobacteriovorax TaxID=2639665 RepID=UPI000CD23163|nr:PHB depolymerase family esterase [Halobacteriovorax sp. DA5]POB14458.1 polyhydroxybutyrate depolymerase [Halobacteriovorax sp. DA5]